MSEPSEPAVTPDPPTAVDPPAFRMNGERIAGFDSSKARRFDFRNPDFVSEADLRQLNTLHTSYVQHLSARLSTFMRMECGLKVTDFASTPFAKFAESLPADSHLTLFQIEPLSGVGIVSMSVPLGFAMADRLLGGKGRVASSERALTEIEIALLDDVVELALQEWSQLWEKEDPSLKPLCIGHETGGRFLQTSAPDASIIVTAMELTFGEMTEKVQLAIPFPLIELLLRQRQQTQPKTTESSPKKMQWRAPYAGIAVPVSAEWKLDDLSLGEVMRFSEGQVLELPRDLVSETRVRLSNTEEFLGTVGVQNGQIAVHLTKRIVKD